MEPEKLTACELAILRRSSEMDATLSDEELLQKGRSGQISVYFSTISSVLNDIPVEKIANTISSAKDNRYQGAILDTQEMSNNPRPAGMGSLRMNSQYLSILLKDIEFEIQFDKISIPETNMVSDDETDEKQDAEQTEESAEPSPEPEKAHAKPARAPSRKKTKYTMTKAALVEMLTGSMDTEDTREIRAFLLSLPDYKPQDVALMTDRQVADIFLKDYKCLAMTGGTLILPAKDFDKLTAFLGGLETYFISKKEPDTEA